MYRLLKVLILFLIIPRLRNNLLQPLKLHNVSKIVFLVFSQIKENDIFDAIFLEFIYLFV